MRQIRLGLLFSLFCTVLSATTIGQVVTKPAVDSVSEEAKE